MALPALRVIERAFPDAERRLLTNIPIHSKAPAAYSVLHGSGLVHGYMDYPWRTRSPLRLARLWWQIVSFRPQVLIYMMRSRGPGTVQRDAAFFRLCGVRHIVGLPLGPLDVNLYDEKTGLYEQEASRLARQVGTLGTVDVQDLGNWDLQLTDSEKECALRELAPLDGDRFIVVAIGGKMQATDWGTENWRDLLGRLSAHMPDHSLVMVGAQGDFDASEIASAEWHRKALNLCGRLLPRETAAVAARSELFLGRDSGPKYLAAVAGVPCAVVYAARNLPGVWYPPGRANRNLYHHVDCANCDLEVCIEQGKKCLTSITVEAMLSAALEAWREGQAASPDR